MRKDPEAANGFLKATLVIVFVSVNELYVHVPKEFSMWNNIGFGLELSQLYFSVPLLLLAVRVLLEMRSFTFRGCRSVGGGVFCAIPIKSRQVACQL